MKQEKKNKVLAVSLLGLLLVLFAMLLFQKNEDGVDKGIFKIPELSEVSKVILKSKNSEVNLTFNGAKWRVNEKYTADDQLITVLFATLQQVEPKRQVSSLLRDSVTSFVTSNGVHISLWTGDQEVKTFYLGGNDMKTESYFLDKESGPYLMAIPGYKVYASGVFEVNEMGWRDKRIFDFNWRNFKKLRSHFVGQPNQNFEIEDRGDGFGLTNAPPSDTTMVNDYLDAVSLLLAERFIPPGYNHAYDSLLQQEASVTIEAFDLGDNVYRLELYPALDNDPKVLGKLGEGEAVIFDRRQILPIVRTKDYFRKK